MAGELKSRRRKIRFHPEVFTTAELTLNNGESLRALVIDESFLGARLLISKSVDLKPDDKVQAKVGELSTNQSVIRWVERLDKHQLMVLGIEYIDL